MPLSVTAGSAPDEARKETVAFGPFYSGARGSEKAFTLSELLVLTAYLAILAVLLLPLFNRAYLGGLTVRCRNNFKQLQTAYHMYVDDNNGNLPLNNLGSGAGVTSWIAYNTVGSSAQNAYNTANIRGGTLYPYNQNVKIYVCPANTYSITVSTFGARDDFGNLLKLGALVPETRTCSIESSLGLGGSSVPAWTESGGGYTWQTYQKITSLQPGRIAGKIVFVDEASGSVDDGAFALWPMNTYNYWWNVPASRNDRGGVFSFADGHVEYHRWLGSYVPGNYMQTSGPGNGGLGFPGSPFWGPVSASADLADLAWVQAGGPQYP
jgi:prepilin-type processing-associated H-X9-DG protein